MALIYITGIAGAGKSAVCGELVRRGFAAHEADDTLSNFYVNATGVAANEEDYIGIFDKVIALAIDNEALQHRIFTRHSGDFGRSPHEFASLLEWQQTTDEYYRKVGAYVIDGTKPLAMVIEEIITQLGLSE